MHLTEIGVRADAAGNLLRSPVYPELSDCAHKLRACSKVSRRSKGRRGKFSGVSYAPGVPSVQALSIPGRPGSRCGDVPVDSVLRAAAASPRPGEGMDATTAVGMRHERCTWSVFRHLRGDGR